MTQPLKAHVFLAVDIDSVLPVIIEKFLIDQRIQTTILAERFFHMDEHRFLVDHVAKRHRHHAPVNTDHQPLKAEIAHIVQRVCDRLALAEQTVVDPLLAVALAAPVLDKIPRQIGVVRRQRYQLIIRMLIFERIDVVALFAELAPRQRAHLFAVVDIVLNIRLFFKFKPPWEKPLQAFAVLFRHRADHQTFVTVAIILRRVLDRRFKETVILFKTIRRQDPAFLERIRFDDQVAVRHRPAHRIAAAPHKQIGERTFRVLVLTGRKKSIQNISVGQFQFLKTKHDYFSPLNG